MRLALIVALLFSLLSLWPAPKGHVEIRARHYPDGALMERAEALVEPGGKPVYHGRFQAFSRGGIMMAEGEYVHGVRDGLWRYWSDAGVFEGEGDYRDGRCDYTQFHPDGSVQLRGPMIGKRRTGIWREWYRSGRLKARGEFIDDAMHGPWEFWTDEDPPQETRVRYEHGRQLP